ncbi:phosphatase PAP2 family protein [Jidongwangia harbinensis]|uniref:phosphatase PAP2 family protein n=1 Tax=Jidongwangia harbinensis TaxID=2878561 RepID=UPI001CD9F703|nr:phosphatase PAP2 family protein [Jidongwangia harbinensis]MCA2213619.1 phosphatase PAP2 family protein [Jidongwangia harbinensis]
MTRPKNWWPDLASLVGFVLLTGLLAAGHLLDLDAAVADWADDHRPAPLYWAARVLNYLGQGGQVLMPVSVLLAGVLAWRRRSVRPLIVFAAGFGLTYLTIGPLKVWLQRAAPRFDGPDRTHLFNEAAIGPLGMSYPSGHVANALVWYGVIALLLAALLGGLDPRVHAALRIVPPAVVFVTTTYLSFHWITDSVAGLLLGLVLTRLMARVPWDTMPLPRLPDGWDRPAGLQPTQEPARMTRLT